jgi:hypothetical protein
VALRIGGSIGAESIANVPLPPADEGFLRPEPHTPQTPHFLLSMREITFRAAGEGTGKHSDLDAYDGYYWHLLLWHKTRQELVGAYRAANTEES